MAGFNAIYAEGRTRTAGGTKPPGPEPGRIATIGLPQENTAYLAYHCVLVSNSPQGCLLISLLEIYLTF